MRSSTSMFGPFSHLQYRPCPDCGASVAAAELDFHECDPERRLDYQMFQLRIEVEAFDGEFQSYLETSHGRFELWYAEQQRLGQAA